MICYFAAVFSARNAAERARSLLDQLKDEHALSLTASVIVGKGEDGEITLYNAKTPGALGAGLGGVLGGILGLIGGPMVAAVGAAAGAMSGGWFDLLRVDERNAFLNEVAGKISTSHFALLAEVIEPSDEIKGRVDSRIAELGGSIVLKDC